MHESDDQHQPEQRPFRRVVLFQTKDGLQQGEVIGWGPKRIKVRLADGSTKTLPRGSFTDRGVIAEDLLQGRRDPSLEELEAMVDAHLKQLGWSREEATRFFTDLGRDELFAPLFDWTQWFAKVQGAAQTLYKELNGLDMPEALNPLDKDLAFLWEYAQRELLVELGKPSKSNAAATQDRIFDAHEHYFNKLVEDYLRWRRKRWEEYYAQIQTSQRLEEKESRVRVLHLVWQIPVQHFIRLQEFPRFVRPEARRGAQSHRLERAAEDFFLLSASLEQKKGERFSSAKDKVQKITEAIAEVFLGLSDPKQLKNVLSKQERKNLQTHLHLWRSETSLKKIALEAIEWKHDVTPGSLERYLPQYRSRVSSRLADPRLRTAWLMLSEGKKIRISQMLLRTRARWQPGESSAS